MNLLICKLFCVFVVLVYLNGVNMERCVYMMLILFILYFFLLLFSILIVVLGMGLFIEFGLFNVFWDEIRVIKFNLLVL